MSFTATSICMCTMGLLYRLASAQKAVVPVAPDDTVHGIHTTDQIYVYPLMEKDWPLLEQIKSNTSEKPNCGPDDELFGHFWVLKDNSIRIPVEVLTLCNATITRQEYNNYMLMHIRNIKLVRTPDHPYVPKVNMEPNKTIYEYALLSPTLDPKLVALNHTVMLLSTYAENFHVLRSYYDHLFEQIEIEQHSMHRYRPECVFISEDDTYLHPANFCMSRHRMAFRPGTATTIPDVHGSGPETTGSVVRFTSLHCCCDVPELCKAVEPLYPEQPLCLGVQRELIPIDDGTIFERLKTSYYYYDIMKPNTSVPHNFQSSSQCILMIRILRVPDGDTRLKITVSISQIDADSCHLSKFYDESNRCHPVQSERIGVRSICCAISINQTMAERIPSDMYTQVTNNYMFKGYRPTRPNALWQMTENFKHEVYDCFYGYEVVGDVTYCFAFMVKVGLTPIFQPIYSVVLGQSYVKENQYLLVDGVFLHYQSAFSIYLHAHSMKTRCRVMALNTCEFPAYLSPAEWTMRHCIDHPRSGRLTVAVMCQCTLHGTPYDLLENASWCKDVMGENGEDFQLARSYSHIFCYEKQSYTNQTRDFSFISDVEEFYNRLPHIDCMPSPVFTGNESDWKSVWDRPPDVKRQCANDVDGYICCCLAVVSLTETSASLMCNNGSMLDAYIRDQKFYHKPAEISSTYRDGVDCEYSYTTSVISMGFGIDLNPLCLFLMSMELATLGEIVSIGYDPTAETHPKEKFLLIDKSVHNFDEWRPFMYASKICSLEDWTVTEHIRGCACRAMFQYRDPAVNDTVGDRIACCCSSDLVTPMASFGVPVRILRPL